MPKIIIFSTAYFPIAGGAEVAVREVTNRLPHIQFDLITARMKKELPVQEKQGNVTVYRVGFGNAFDKFLLIFWGPLVARRLNKANNYNLVWSIMASQAGIAASFFKVLCGKTMLLTVQEGNEESHLRRYVGGSRFLYNYLIRPWHRLVFKKADRITAISSYLLKRARRSGAKCGIDLVPNGVDIELFSQEYKQSELDALRTKLNKGNRRYIITVSRLVRKNGVEDVIRAMTLLNQDIDFLILGDGSDREKMEKLAKDLHVDHRVKFLGWVEHSEMPKYLKISELFIRSSLSEGLGNVFLEAMAAGIPVIGTPVGGIPDFLMEEETGIFCQPANYRDIARKIRRVLNEKDLRAYVVKNGSRIVKDIYDWNKIAVEMERIFKEWYD